MQAVAIRDPFPGRKSGTADRETATAIRAELRGPEEAHALGLTAFGHAPVLRLCRLLVASGHDPDRHLHAYRGEVLCLRVRSIGEGARLTVKTVGSGRPMFVLDDVAEGAAASLVRKNKSVDQ
jgi:hypothetical protein